MQSSADLVVEHLGFAIPRPLAVRTGTLEGFTAVSDAHLAHLRRSGGLDAARNVVEIGCGVGRDAIALLRGAPQLETYLGIDVMAASIDWARGNISPRAPGYDFVHFDVADRQHNPAGSGCMTDYRIPRPAHSQDLVFLFSVFTHMFPADVALYLQEFSRILRSGGRVLASMFVMEPDDGAHLLAVGGGGLRGLTFRHEVAPGFFHNDPEVVPGATAYALPLLERMAGAAGLRLREYVRGSWRRDGRWQVRGQDVVVLEPAAG